MVPFQIADLSIGILWILAMSSLMVYAIVLAGWSSGSNYPLLGGVRSSAQMISYEVGMALAIVAVAHVLGHAADVRDRGEPGQDLERDPAVPRVRRST